MGKTNGGQQVILNGLNFGPYSDGATVTYGVADTEYKPTDCVVRSHQKITCLTVPGIGSALFWHVTVREQSNALTATTSYAAPYINSMTPAGGVSADGSDLQDFLVYLNVSCLGLKDRLSNIVIQMDVACKLTLNTCSPYEIPIEPFGATSTRQEGEFDILAFACRC